VTKQLVTLDQMDAQEHSNAVETVPDIVVDMFYKDLKGLAENVVEKLLRCVTVEDEEFRNKEKFSASVVDQGVLN